MKFKIEYNNGEINLYEGKNKISLNEILINKNSLADYYEFYPILLETYKIFEKSMNSLKNKSKNKKGNLVGKLELNLHNYLLKEN
ncbi:hypothetical protein CO037_01085 [Candidatus Pacearchaeota archaeon CG_4_9_14_0_2_um_filter_30_8]|nr:MAG: hypothetical protein CO037_01085 [Candidatus Pacearchaeota archaeon CG_4_9_14_0_2_um_filter_30_8]